MGLLFGGEVEAEVDVWRDTGALVVESLRRLGFGGPRSFRKSSTASSRCCLARRFVVLGNKCLEICLGSLSGLLSII